MANASRELGTPLLLDNAIQYTGSGGHIVLRAEPEGSWLRTQVLVES